MGNLGFKVTKVERRKECPTGRSSTSLPNYSHSNTGSGDPILFLHGNPTSSYLWRNIIPHLTPFARAIAPDLIGMGKSDKPDIEYSFFDHVEYVEGFIEALELQNITLVIHDWGSALGFHYAMLNPDNVKGLAFMEAILAPVPSWDDFPEAGREAFQGFRTPDVGWDMIVNQNMFVEFMQVGVARKLDEAKTHPNRHVITRALGLEPQVTVENQQMPRSDGDLILVCSDGLHGLVEDEEIASVLTNNGPEGACEALVEVARGYGGDDNITVAVARVHLLGAETQKIPKGRLARIVRLLRLRTRY